MESLIFDIDGTLWDSRALVAEGYNIQLRREGMTDRFVTAETLRPLFGKVLTEIADALFGDLAPSDRYSLMERCMATENQFLHENECPIGYPKVKETLLALSKTHRLFIVSNSQQGYPELCMEKLGIGKCFSGHLCFGDTGTDKGTTISRLMQQHHITSALYVGDTQGDLEATEKAGIPFVWAAYGFGNPERYDFRLDSIEDLLTLRQEGKL